AARPLEVGFAVDRRKPELALAYELVVTEPEAGWKPSLHRLVEEVEVARETDDPGRIAVAEADVEGEHVDCFTPRSRTRIVLGCACARSDTLAALGPTVRLVGWGDHRRRVYAPAMSLVEYAAADGVAT